MKHFLAYGNSDQASFVSPEVRDCLDYMSVPATIAAYYSEATAAFVRSSQLEYVIDPRTPLFQETLKGVRASHVSLSSRLGPTIQSRVKLGATVSFPASFYTQAVIQQLV